MESEMILKAKSSKLARMKKIVLEIAATEQRKKETNAEFKEEIDRLFEELNQLANEDEKQGEIDLPAEPQVFKKKRARKDTDE